MESLYPCNGNGNSRNLWRRGDKEKNRHASSGSTFRALRPPSAALTGRPKVAPLCQNLFVCQYRRSPFHNFSQGQLDLAALTGKMIEDIIGRHQHPCSQNRAHRERTHTHSHTPAWVTGNIPPTPPHTHTHTRQRYEISSLTTSRD